MDEEEAPGLVPVAQALEEAQAKKTDGPNVKAILDLIKAVDDHIPGQHNVHLAVYADIAAARKLGTPKGQLLAYTNSNDVMRRKMGQTSRDSVGYAAIVF